MPYVPSKKTDGKSEDREILDKHVEILGHKAAERIRNNHSLTEVYRRIFTKISRELEWLYRGGSVGTSPESGLAKTLYLFDKKYGYEGASLGELNYIITRFIQRVPRIKVEKGDWKEELRYWLYAATVSALVISAIETADLGIGVSGVFEDIKDEYKRRVNVSYEAEQIIKSGDCYGTPFYTRLIEVVDKEGNHVGYQEVMLKRSEETLNKDLLDGKVVLG